MLRMVMVISSVMILIRVCIVCWSFSDSSLIWLLMRFCMLC